MRQLKKKEDNEDGEAEAASQRKDNYIWNWLYIKLNQSVIVF